MKSSPGPAVVVASLALASHILDTLIQHTKRKTHHIHTAIVLQHMDYLPSVTSRPPRRLRQQLQPQVVTKALSVAICGAFVSMVGMSIYGMFISPWPQHPSDLSGGLSSFESGVDTGVENSYATHNSYSKRELFRPLAPIKSDPSNYSRKPLVVGHYSFRVNNPQAHSAKNDTATTSTISRQQYVYLTERINPYLLSHTSQTLRRIRTHDDPSNFYSVHDSLENYKRAIVDSNAEHILTKDPLTQLMLNFDQRAKQRKIRDNSDDYFNQLADPFIDQYCDIPKHSEWMLTSFPTCNLIHEFGLVYSLGRGKTKIIGNGFWRDVWRVVDTSISVKRLIAMKTIVSTACKLL